MCEFLQGIFACVQKHVSLITELSICYRQVVWFLEKRHKGGRAAKLTPCKGLLVDEDCVQLVALTVV